MHNDTKTAEEYISELLNIPKKLKVLSMVAIVYPDEKKSPHGKEKLQYEKMSLDVYGKSYKNPQ